MESIYKSDVVVVGSGISGLMVAISLYPRKVTLVTKKKLGEMSSSAWAQGGIAAAVGKDGAAVSTDAGASGGAADASHL